MRVLICPDKFKNSLTAAQVCDAVEHGIKSKNKDFEIVKMPLADGGEGTSEILTALTGGKFITVEAHDPLFRIVEASYGISGDGSTAFIEMSSASGLKLLKPNEYNPLKATTFGTGELIRHALESGVTKIILGIGGSATNDGGIGAAAALGFKFLDDNGAELQPTGENLFRIKKIQFEHVFPSLSNTTFQAMCDVNNPLTGIDGASVVFGPQKGATQHQVTLLDEGLLNLGNVIEKELGHFIQNVPGAGAGGGIGGGAIAFFQAELKSGIELVMEMTNFEEEAMKADLIITGEGKMDSQSLQGKVVAGVAAIAMKHHKRLMAVAGRNDIDKSQQQALQIEKIFALTDFESEAVAIRDAFSLLSRVISEHMSLVI